MRRAFCGAAVRRFWHGSCSLLTIARFLRHLVRHCRPATRRRQRGNALVDLPLGLNRLDPGDVALDLPDAAPSWSAARPLPRTAGPPLLVQLVDDGSRSARRSARESLPASCVTPPASACASSAAATTDLIALRRSGTPPAASAPRGAAPPPPESSRTPATSNMIRPGLTTATQYSGLPLPEPMRVSAGFCVTGLSGKIRIQTLPPRFR